MFKILPNVLSLVLFFMVFFCYFNTCTQLFAWEILISIWTTTWMGVVGRTHSCFYPIHIYVCEEVAWIHEVCPSVWTTLLSNCGDVKYTYQKSQCYFSAITVNIKLINSCSASYHKIFWLLHKKVLKQI